MPELSLLEALNAAGLELVSDDATASVPIAVASLAASCRPEDGRRDEVVGREDPDLVQRVNASWFRVASEYGVLDSHKEFLVMVGGGIGSPSILRWAHVRLMAEWDLAGVGAATGVLGSAAEFPDFTTIPLKGDPVIRVTSYQDCVSVIYIPTLRGVPWVQDYLFGRIDRAAGSVNEIREFERWLNVPGAN